MSFMMSAPNPGRENGLPRGELLSTHSTREAAQDQLRRLVDAEVPPTAVTIVGKDLRVVERVRGRLSYPQAALGAGLRGLLFGTMIGVFMYLLAPAGGAQQIVFSALLGVGLWMILGVIAHGMRKDKNGFASTQLVVPAAFDVVVAFEHAGRARAVLTGGSGQAVTAPDADGTGRPGSAPHGAAADRAPEGQDRHEGAAQDRPEATAEAGQAEPEQTEPAQQSAAQPPAEERAPQGLDRAYGLRLSQEEVDRIIAARGGTPGQSQPPEPPQGGSGR